MRDLGDTHNSLTTGLDDEGAIKLEILISDLWVQIYHSAELDSLIIERLTDQRAFTLKRFNFSKEMKENVNGCVEQMSSWAVSQFWWLLFKIKIFILHIKEIQKFWSQFEIGSLHDFVLKKTILELSCLRFLHAFQLIVRDVLQFLTARISWWAMDA